MYSDSYGMLWKEKGFLIPLLRFYYQFTQKKSHFEFIFFYLSLTSFLRKRPTVLFHKETGCDYDRMIT